MPPLDTSGRALGVFEFWPMWAFYPPVLLYAFYLMLRYRGWTLPTVANPSFPGGGFVGESKARILELAIRHAPQWFAPFITVQRDSGLDSDLVRELLQRSCNQMEQAGLTFPIVAKPDMGCRGAGIKLLRDASDLHQYIQNFPGDARFLLQKYVAFEGEAGVFYCRHPSEDTGRIISLTLKYFPYVFGDGKRSLRELILADERAGKLAHLYLPRHAQRLDQIPAPGEAVRLAFAGSHSRGGLFSGTERIGSRPPCKRGLMLCPNKSQSFNLAATTSDLKNLPKSKQATGLRSSRSTVQALKAPTYGTDGSLCSRPGAI